MRTMKNVIGITAIGIILTLFGSQSIFAQNTAGYTKKGLQDLYMKYLVEEGFQPKVDGDGDVVFKREGGTYFIRVSENDPQFFSLVFPNFWLIESEAERLRVYAAANLSNGVTKVCKIFTMKDNVWAAVELFVASPPDFKGVFRRSMSALDGGRANFRVNMILNPGRFPSILPSS